MQLSKSPLDRLESERSPCLSSVVLAGCLADWLVGMQVVCQSNMLANWGVSLSLRVPSVLNRVDSVSPIVNVPVSS